MVKKLKTLRALGFTALALLPGGLALAIAVGLVRMPWASDRGHRVAVDAVLAGLVCAALAFLGWVAWGAQ